MPCAISYSGYYSHMQSSSFFSAGWRLPSLGLCSSVTFRLCFPDSSPVKELAENGHRIGSTPPPTNDQKSWPGMKSNVSCNHLFPPLEQKRSSTGLGEVVWDTASPQAPETGQLPQHPCSGLCLQLRLALSDLQTLWLAALYATLTFLSLHIQRSSGIWTWIMSRMHNPIAALYFLSWLTHCSSYSQRLSDEHHSTAFEGRNLAGVGWKNTTYLFVLFESCL